MKRIRLGWDARTPASKVAKKGRPHPAGPQETLEVHPRYSECEWTTGRVFKAEVNTTGCNYVLHVLNQDPTSPILPIRTN